MNNRPLIKNLKKLGLGLGLLTSLSLLNLNHALAANTGGRAGGSNFGGNNTPAQTVPNQSPQSQPSSPSYSYEQSPSSSNSNFSQETFALQVQINRLNGRISTLESDLTMQTGNVSTLTQEKTSLTAEIDDLKGEIINLEALLVTEKEKYEALKLSRTTFTKDTTAIEIEKNKTEEERKAREYEANQDRIARVAEAETQEVKAQENILKLQIDKTKKEIELQEQKNIEQGRRNLLKLDMQKNIALTMLEMGYEESEIDNVYVETVITDLITVYADELIKEEMFNFVPVIRDNDNGYMPILVLTNNGSYRVLDPIHKITGYTEEEYDYYYNQLQQGWLELSGILFLKTFLILSLILASICAERRFEISSRIPVLNRFLTNIN